MYKLIIADDEITIRQGLIQLIQSYDLNIELLQACSNGKEALAAVKHCHPQLLLVDINMPKLNGLDFIEQISDLVPESKIIIITGYDQFEYAQRALKLGVYDYLLKPVSRAALYNSLRNAIRAYSKRHYELNQLSRFAQFNLDEEVTRDQAFYYLLENFNDSSLTLASLAEEFHISTANLSRQIHQKTGMSFSDYLNSLRIEQAISLLSSSSSVMIYNVAEQVGYSSQHYFCRIFKEYTGFTPREFRRKAIYEQEEAVKHSEI